MCRQSGKYICQVYCTGEAKALVFSQVMKQGKLSLKFREIPEYNDFQEKRGKIAFSIGLKQIYLLKETLRRLERVFRCTLARNLHQDAHVS